MSLFSFKDNEDEIAEFMEASINIKKNKINRKKTKQARELENVKKYLEAENNINEDEKSTSKIIFHPHQFNKPYQSFVYKKKKN